VGGAGAAVGLSDERGAAEGAGVGRALTLGAGVGGAVALAAALADGATGAGGEAACVSPMNEWRSALLAA
jgi:hypothetical protein